jgi:cell division protein FtsW
MSLINIKPRSNSRAATKKKIFAEGLDGVLITIALVILCLGLVMVTSASITVADRQMGQPFYYLERQLMAALMGLGVMMFMLKTRLANWERSGMLLLGFAFMLLILVLIPGVGKTVNGSSRWIPVGIFNLQVSELAKLWLLIYVAGYLVRHGEEVRSSLKGFIKPMFMVGLAAILMLLEPDFGAAAVIMTTTLAMMFLGGVRFLQFLAFISLFAVAAAMLILSSPYRMERLTAFVNPWADPFDSGFQLTQSLIAIGSGGWTGVGLGASVQKLFYLPEAHTDFVFAVLAEEFGLLGVLLVIGLFTALVTRAFMIARRAETHGNMFASYLAYGIGIWLAMQAFINIGVNMGVLPTKGLTLPLMSYGGSSLIVCCAAIGLLLRIHYECSNSQAMSRQPSAPASSPRAQRENAKDVRSLLEDAA